MKKRFASIAIGLWVAMSTTTASADCFADYKAKQESPLRLHYGVIEVDAQPCSLSGAITRIVEQRLAAGGWMLLQVESVFDETGLEGRKKDAGQFYLRY